MSQSHPLQHAAAAARTGNTALAKIHLQKAAEADPDDPAVWLWMGWLSDSPLNMIQCLEMLLEHESYRPVAEAGMYFAQTLADFRHSPDASSSSPSAAATPVMQVQPTTEPRPSAHVTAPHPESASSATHVPPAEPGSTAPIQPTEFQGTQPKHHAPTPAATMADESVVHADLNQTPAFVVETPQLETPVPEIVFEDSIDPVLAQHDNTDHDGGYVELPSEPGSFRTEHGTPVSAATQQLADAFRTAAPGPDVSQSIPAVALEQTAAAFELNQSVLSVAPETMYRAARADWFSPARNSEGATQTDAAQPVPSMTSVPPAQPMNPPAAIDVDRRPTSEAPPPVWQTPAPPRPQVDSWSDHLAARADSIRVAADGASASREAGLSTSHDQTTQTTGVSDNESASTPSVPSTPESTTILVVDDSPTVRNLVAMTLEKRGYRVVTAIDGVAAIKEIAAQNPALVLVDVNMPRLDGYQLCKLVKKHGSTQHIPVIMLAGNDGVFDRLRGRLVGCAGYITKPFIPEALVESVERYLSQAAHS